MFLVLNVNYDYFDFFACNYPPDGWDSCEKYCRDGPRDQRLYDRCWNVHQYDWIESELSMADQDPAVTLKVVFLHAPVYTGFDDHPAFSSSRALADLLDRHRVALVFNGHNHWYERTVPIKGGAQDPSGTTYVTTSGGGVDTWDGPGDWFTAAHFPDHHYVRVDVLSDTVTCQAKGLDGSVLDSFTVER